MHLGKILGEVDIKLILSVLVIIAVILKKYNDVKSDPKARLNIIVRGVMGLSAAILFLFVITRK
ncbi:hypothetical protein HLB30_03270 [Peptostreptococcus russellii]|uniref:hypothetical protein n=1 Tax=Peptostreptococcus russellii TaxID=215200 RepID=UPI00162ABE5C|nr:hypothetical protein [Peptostreptococcus russellii]MBC2577540.1 hypothetical protein [Peptostreptococcus russellii]